MVGKCPWIKGLGGSKRKTSVSITFGLKAQDIDSESRVIIRAEEQRKKEGTWLRGGGWYL